MASVKTFINAKNKYDRVIVLVDMDAFYTQVEEKLDPTLQGKPIAVVQYNAWKGGGIIAVNYVARAKGVGRHMRGDEAKELCPDIVLCRVPQVREKADLSKYRTAGAEVAAVLQQFTTLVERASIDEAYLDITDIVVKRLLDMNVGKYILMPAKLTGTYVVGFDTIGTYVQDVSKGMKSTLDMEEEERKAMSKSNIKLLLAADIVNEIRAEVRLKTGFTCSAGIAHNKILAKLSCGMNKPNKQTILPLNSIPFLYNTLPIGKVKGLGGKFGENVCESLQIKTMAELLPYSEKELQKKFEEKMGSFLYNMARGVDLECVVPRYNAKSIGCSKKFPGQNAISGMSTLTHWLGELATELVERLEKDNLENMRTAKLMTVTFTQQIGSKDVASTRSVPLVQYNVEKIAGDSLEAIKKSTEKFLKCESGTLNNPIKLLGIGASKFEDEGIKSNTLQNMLSNHAVKPKEAREPMAGSTKEKLASFAPKKQAQLSSFFSKKKEEIPEKEEIPKKEEISEKEEIPETEEIPKKKEISEKEEIPETEEIPKKEESKPKAESQSLLQLAEVNDPNDLMEEQELLLETPDPINEQENDEANNSLEEDKENPTATCLDPEKGEQSSPKNQEEDVEDDRSSCSDIFAEYRSDSPKNCEEELEMDPGNTSVGSEHEETTEILNVDNNFENKPSTSAAEVQPSTSKSPEDYTKTYAEFQGPSSALIPSLLDLTNCHECQKDIPTYQLPEHLDNHFAFKLSNQLREEYRSEHKIDLSTRFAKPKLKPKESKLPSVAKFLTKIGLIKETSEEDDSKKVKCNECEKMILFEALDEHKDYHFAKNLQNSESILTNENKVESKVATNKRKSSDCSKKDLNPKSKMIKTYFTKNP